jgi:hypothetical protein
MRSLCLTLVLGEARMGGRGAHQCASTILNVSLTGDLSILGRAFNKIKSCNKEISNIRGKGWGKWITPIWRILNIVYWLIKRWITATSGRFKTLKIVRFTPKWRQGGPIWSTFQCIFSFSEVYGVSIMNKLDFNFSYTHFFLKNPKTQPKLKLIFKFKKT